MILVTLGTQDKPFARLLEAVEKQINLGHIKDEVIVQAGCTKFKSDKMKIFDYLAIDEFNKLMNDADIIITHGGVGTIIAGLKNNKKVIVAARLQKYGEHTNDHQLQILDNFGQEGYILPLENFEELDKVIEKAKSFKPKEFKSNTSEFVLNLKKEIEKYT